VGVFHQNQFSEGGSSSGSFFVHLASGNIGFFSFAIGCKRTGQDHLLEGYVETILTDRFRANSARGHGGTMKLGALQPAPGARKKTKRVGRGTGSGHDGTSCRGQRDLDTTVQAVGDTKGRILDPEPNTGPFLREGRPLSREGCLSGDSTTRVSSWFIRWSTWAPFQRAH
jgi:hypothetical protein